MQELRTRKANNALSIGELAELSFLETILDKYKEKYHELDNT